MTGANFRRENHYVSRGYLKRWLSSSGNFWAYRTLVSYPTVPVWKQVSPGGVAYHTHLYTQIVAGEESDQFERWLSQEIEYPAEESLRKATSDARMAPDDWTRLIRFVAAQDVRTPARYREYMQRWRATLPGIIDQTLSTSVQRLEQAMQSGQACPEPETDGGDGFPIKIVKEYTSYRETGHIKAEVLMGRGLWIWSMKHILERTLRGLERHKWTILRPPKGFEWFTSDDPVLRLNFHSPSRYDFRGGWDSPGTEIIVPLGPQHLLYTQIGKRPPMRGQRMSIDQAMLVRRFIAEHAYTMIFASTPDDEVTKLRPRTVDGAAFQRQRVEWERWHQEQSAAELELVHGDE